MDAKAGSGPGSDFLASVKAADTDRYRSILFAPENLREPLAVLWAFDAEIDAIAGRVREPLPGEIRLQWWREAIAGTRDGEVAGHPPASALRDVIRTCNLQPAAFERLLDARIFDLYHDPMPDRASLEAYLGETVSALHMLAAQILNDGRTVAELADAAGHGGVAAGLVRIMQRLPVHRARGQAFVPADMLAPAGMDVDRLFGQPDAAASGRLAAALVALAREHFDLFRAAARTLPPHLRPAFLPVAAAEARLRDLERAGPAIVDRLVKTGSIRPLAAMTWRGIRGWRNTL